jgi:transcriptional regulator with XRE-family HTH domain
MSAGQLLRDARKKLGLTLAEVGRKLPGNLTAAYISDIELGRRPLTAERIPQFVKILKLSREEANEVYQAAGILPDDVLARVLSAPKAWDFDFRALAALPPESVPTISRREAKKGL